MSFFGKVLFTPLSVFGLCLFIASSVYGDEGILKTGTKNPVVDGVVGKQEYSYSYETNKMTLYLNRSSHTINAALVAQTEGWVGIGFKSSVMDSSEILIGYVRDGEQSYKEQIGVGKRHRDEKLPGVRSLVLTESGGKTTLEVELAEEVVLESGDESLSLIIAFGEKDSFSSYHRMRKGLTVNLKD